MKLSEILKTINTNTLLKNTNGEFFSPDVLLEASDDDQTDYVIDSAGIWQINETGFRSSTRPAYQISCRFNDHLNDEIQHAEKIKTTENVATLWQCHDANGKIRGAIEGETDQLIGNSQSLDDAIEDWQDNA